MKKRIQIIYLMVLGLLSCQDLVEVDAPDNQLGTVQVFEDVQTARAAMAGLYADLRDRSMLSGNFHGTGSLLGTYADELDCYTNDQNGLMDIYQATQQETNTQIESVWNKAYEQIYKANAIIQGVLQSDALSDTEQKELQGEALLVRSLLYFYLQQLFGAIPYTTSLDYEYNRQLERMEASAVLEQLVMDVSEAVSLLEDTYRSTERIYPNRKVAQLLLARIYLTQGQWSMAEQTLQLVLNAPMYAFETDVTQVFKKSGSHILWQLPPEHSGDATKEAAYYYFASGVPNSYALTEDLVGAFEPNDLRLTHWIAEVTNEAATYYRPYKYKNLTGTNTDEYSIVFRLAEVYTMMAEALWRQDRTTEAVPYLNAIRERAGLGALSGLTSEDFKAALLLEKRREFFVEFGQRFMDLKRLDALQVLDVLKPAWENFNERWPLPQSELLLNGALAPQNTGY